MILVPFLVALALWSLMAAGVGWVTGVPMLRSFGLLGCVGFFGCAFLWDQWMAFKARQRQARRWENHVREKQFRDDYLLIDVSQIDWSQWPDYRKRGAA